MMQGEVLAIPVVYCAHPLQIPSWVFWCASVPGVGGQRSERIAHRERTPSGETYPRSKRSSWAELRCLRLALSLQEGALRARKG